MPAPPDSQRRGTVGSLIPATGREKRSSGIGSAMRGRCAASGGGLGHRERIEQSLLLELKQPLPGYDLNDPAEDVGRVAIVPARTRLFGKRQFCETLGELSVIKVAVEQAGIRVELSHRAVAVKPIGEA